MSNAARIRRPKAATFAALGDETRLRLLSKLTQGQPRSITDLTHCTTLTRQAVRKHLRVLEQARVVRVQRVGRESLFSLNPAPIVEMQAYLQQVSGRWNDALTRLKTFVEAGPA